MKKSRSLQSWYPHENKDEKSKCKLTCYSRESREFYQTGENVVDGTRCSYDRPNDICVHGKCVPLGCDMVSLTHYKFKLSEVRKKIGNEYILFIIIFQILGSPVKQDQCGICGGDGSKCRLRKRKFDRQTSKRGNSKMMMLPTGARNIQIHFISRQNVSLSIKERQTNLMVHQSQQSWNHSVFITEGFCVYIFCSY